MTSRVVVQPTNEQILLADAKDHLRLIDDDDQDDWIERQIPAVREWCENYLGLSLAPQTREWTADHLSGEIELPFGPVTSVYEAEYVDTTGVTQELGDYVTHYGRLVPSYGYFWPMLRYQPGAVRVRYEAGYGYDGDSPLEYPLPKAIRSAMLLLLGHFFENRESTAVVKLEEIPMGIVSLLDPYRVRMSMA